MIVTFPWPASAFHLVCHHVFIMILCALSQADRQRLSILAGAPFYEPLPNVSHADPDINSDVFWNRYCLVDTVTLTRVDDSACDFTIRRLPTARAPSDEYSLLLKEPELPAGAAAAGAGKHMDHSRQLNVSWAIQVTCARYFSCPSLCSGLRGYVP